MRTIGISPKAIFAATLPALTTLVAVLTQWAATGEFDRVETVTALSGIAGSILAFLGAYLGNPGTVADNVGPANDELLRMEDGYSLVELLVICFVALLCVVVLLAVLDRV